MDHRVFSFDYPNLLNRLAQVQPIVFLDVFLGSSGVGDHQRRLVSDDFTVRGNPLSQIPDDKLLSWCEHNPPIRYPLIASAIEVVRESDETHKLEWKPIVYSILERAPDLGAVLGHLVTAIIPMSWSGSLADILQSRSVLLHDLYEHDNSEIRAWARRQYSDVQEAIRKEREWEDQHNRELNERFE